MARQANTLEPEHLRALTDYATLIERQGVGSAPHVAAVLHLASRLAVAADGATPRVTPVDVELLTRIGAGLLASADEVDPRLLRRRVDLLPATRRTLGIAILALRDRTAAYVDALP